MVCAGRGYGKTRTGAETMIEWAGQLPKGRGALVAKTPADARKVMVEGDSGILACSPPWNYPEWNPSLKTLTWPNGFQAFTYSAYEFDELRGPQHHVAWADELAAWKHMDEAWKQLKFGMRLGRDRGWIPRKIVTTTPRPLELIRSLLRNKRTVVSRGSMYENKENLADEFMAEIEEDFGGTRVGRQEIEGEILEDIEGALWAMKQLDDLRVDMPPIRELAGGGEEFDLVRIVVGVDPAGKAGKKSNKTGIVAAGLGADGHGYTLDDWSCTGKPEFWAARAVELLHKWKGDAIVAEVNNGGDMVESCIAAVDPDVRVIQVTASRAKHVRAEPVSVRYEKQKWHHCLDAEGKNHLKALEDQLVLFTDQGYQGGSSPDNADALVWAATDLMGDSGSFIV